MHLGMQLAALAATGLLPAAMAIPLSSNSESSSASSSISGSSSYSYRSSSVESSSVSQASLSWSSFSTGVPSISASLQPYTSSGPEPTATVIVESFTIPLPHTTGPTTPAPTLSTVVATALVPLHNSTFTTIVHTFTVTESPLQSASVSPFPSASISEDTWFSSAASKSLQSAASQESMIRSIFSEMGSSNSGLGPNAPHAKASTKPGAEDQPKTMITATFTLTLPSTTSTTLVPFFPTHSGPMITDKFTITLPPPPPSTDTTCTTSTTESCTTTTTSSCDETSTRASWKSGVETFTLSTLATITLGNGPKTTSCANETSTPVPSGSDAITVVYTLPGGPGRASQTVTITTVRPRPTTPGESSSFLPTASSTGIWSVGNSTTAGPTATGSPFPSTSGFSWSVSGNNTSFHSTGSGTGKATTPSSSSTTHVVPSPGIIVITETKTFTEVSTATPGTAKTTGHGIQPNGNMTTIAGTGVPTVGPHHHANATASHGHGSAKPTHGAHFPRIMRREDECERDANGGRMILNFDNVTIETDKDRSAPSNQGFANPDQGMQFSSGFQRVVPSPSSLFVPSSPPAMLQYNQLGGSIAKIGVADSCSRFNLVSWNLGCDSTKAPCRFNITGLRRAGGEEVVSGSKVFVVPQASKASGNALQRMDFGIDEFSNLSSFTVELEVDGASTALWWSDDLVVARVCSGLSLCTELERRNDMTRVAEKAAPFWHKPGRVAN